MDRSDDSTALAASSRRLDRSELIESFADIAPETTQETGQAARLLEKRINSYRAPAAALAVALTVVIRPSHLVWASLAVGLLAATAALVEAVLRARPSPAGLHRLGTFAMASDVVVCLTIMWTNLHGQPMGIWALGALPAVEASLRYEWRGCLAGGFASGATAAVWMLARGLHGTPETDLSEVLLPFGILVVAGAGAAAAVGRASQETRLLRRTLDMSNDVVSIFSLDGTLLYASEASIDLLGYTPEELVGKSLAELRPPDEPPPADESHPWEGLEDGTGLVLQRHMRRDGTKVWLEHSVTVVPERGIVHAVSREVSDRVEASHALRDNEERLRLTLELTGTVIWEYQIDTEALRLSENFEQMYGLGSVVGRDNTGGFLDRIHDEDRDRVLGFMVSAVAGRSASFDDEFRMQDVSGRWHWINTRCHLTRGPDGRPDRLIGVGVDVTARREAAEALRQSEESFRVMLASMNDGYVATDAEGRIVEWNQAAQEIYGWTRDEVVGRPMIGTLSPPEDVSRHAAKAASGLHRRPEGALSFRDEQIGLHKDGHHFPVEVTALPSFSDEGMSIKLFIRDITERKAAEAELARRALVDALTGLPNRTLLMDRMDQAIARLARRPSRLAVLFIDLDRFKVVNDSLGHSAGDQLLATVGRRLADSTRALDTVARFGGDEIVVLCEEIDSELEAVEIAERMLEIICAPVRLEERDVVLTASIGIAMTSDPEANPEDLISDADAAMYRAKERGRNRLEMFDELMRTRALSTLETENDLRRALEEGELRLFFQPILTLDGEQIVGTEALVRWQHPRRGLVLPNEFIPLAEETGLIVPLGEWVLAQACHEAAGWARSSALLEHVHVGVNLSGRQLAQPDLPDKVAAAVGGSGLSPSRLFVEITESVLMDGSSPATGSLAAIQAMGVTVIVDDFGTGYSSLTYLRSFPIDALKLDRSFVAGLGNDPTDTAIVESVISMAHALGLRVVAEGIETEDQLEALAALGCDLGQGFYWSPARPAEELEELVGARGSQVRALDHGGLGWSRPFGSSPREASPPAVANG